MTLKLYIYRGMPCAQLKQIFVLSGVTISPIDETHFSIFAPTPSAMEEAKEKIDELLKEDVGALDYLRGVLSKLVKVFHLWSASLDKKSYLSKLHVLHMLWILQTLVKV